MKAKVSTCKEIVKIKEDEWLKKEEEYKEDAKKLEEIIDQELEITIEWE